MTFLRSLLSGDESGVDSVVFMAIVSLVALIGVTVYVAIQDHASFSPSGFASSVLLVIGAGAGGKTARDRLGAPPAPPAAPPGPPQ